MWHLLHCSDLVQNLQYLWGLAIINHDICKLRQFYFFLLDWIPFISISCLITLATTFSTVMNRSDKSGYFCLFPNIKIKAFSFSLLIWCWLWASPFDPSCCSIPCFYNDFPCDGISIVHGEVLKYPTLLYCGLFFFSFIIIFFIFIDSPVLGIHMVTFIIPVLKNVLHLSG